MIIPTHAMSKKLKIEDIRIGMTLCDKKTKFPMQVVGIYADGTIYLDFKGNEGDVWVDNIKFLEEVKLSNS